MIDKSKLVVGARVKLCDAEIISKQHDSLFVSFDDRRSMSIPLWAVAEILPPSIEVGDVVAIIPEIKTGQDIIDYKVMAIDPPRETDFPAFWLKSLIGGYKTEMWGRLTLIRKGTKP